MDTSARVIMAVVLVGLSAGGVLAAAPLDLNDYQGNWALIVYSTDIDDDRPFEANLAISTNWNRFDSRGVEIVDIYPGRFDVAAVGAQFSIAPTAFAMILVDPEGQVELVQRDRQDVDEVLQSIDLWERSPSQ